MGEEGGAGEGGTTQQFDKIVIHMCQDGLLRQLICAHMHLFCDRDSVRSAVANAPGTLGLYIPSTTTESSGDDQSA